MSEVCSRVRPGPSLGEGCERQLEMVRALENLEAGLHDAQNLANKLAARLETVLRTPPPKAGIDGDPAVEGGGGKLWNRIDLLARLVDLLRFRLSDTISRLEV